MFCSFCDPKECPGLAHRKDSSVIVIASQFLGSCVSVLRRGPGKNARNLIQCSCLLERIECGFLSAMSVGNVCRMWPGHWANKWMESLFPLNPVATLALSYGLPISLGCHGQSLWTTTRIPIPLSQRPFASCQHDRCQRSWLDLFPAMSR